MKTLEIFLIFSLVVLAKASDLKLEILVKKIIENTAENFEVNTVNFVNFNNFLNSNFIENYYKLEENCTKFKTSVYVFDSTENFEFKKIQDGGRTFNVIFINSIDEFSNFQGNFDSKTSGFFLIIFQNSTTSNRREIFEKFWSFFIFKVNIVYQDFSGFSVDTFLPFSTSKTCNSIEPVKIADENSLKFPSFFPQNFLNLNSCNLTVTTFDSEALFKNGSEFSGRDYEYIKILSKSLNFTLNLDYMQEIGSWGMIYPNKTITGAFKKVVGGKTSMAIGNYFLTHERIQHMDFSKSYEFDSMVFIIPHQKKLNSLFKLLRPFTFTTWMFIILSISTGSLTIFILTQKSLEIQNFVFGGKIKSPIMNFLMEIFGISQPNLPKNNFARFLLMNFIIFTLILRSAYQGALYNFLQTSEYVKDPINLKEIIERDYQVYMIKAFDDMTEEIISVKNWKIVVKDEEISKIIMKTLYSDFNGAVLTSILEFKEKNRRSMRKYGWTLRKAKVKFL